MEKFWIGVLIKREERRVTRNLVGGFEDLMSVVCVTMKYDDL